MNFNVSFRRSIPNYGLFNQTERKWNGMLGNLSRGEIDMCFTDVTMTHQRYQYFDWTWPIYMSPNVLYIKNVGKSVIKWNAYSKVNYMWYSKILKLLIKENSFLLLGFQLQNLDISVILDNNRIHSNNDIKDSKSTACLLERKLFSWKSIVYLGNFLSTRITRYNFLSLNVQRANHDIFKLQNFQIFCPWKSHTSRCSSLPL